MLSKNRIKFINSLKQKKQREEHGLFIAEGSKIVEELMASSISVKQLVALPAFFKKHATVHNHIECVEVTPAELEKISSLSTPNEVLAVCEIPQRELNTELLKEKLTLVLDDIRDPGNLGTIIRIADWFGIETIICSKETVDAYNSKVVQSTMGSIARVNVHYVDLPTFFVSSEFAKWNRTVYGAVLGGNNIYSEKLNQQGLIVIGNESKGISEETLKYVTNKISIPSFSATSSAESLNAAIATAVICAEFRRNG